MQIVTSTVDQVGLVRHPVNQVKTLMQIQALAVVAAAALIPV
jgi:hypothetical protein